MKNSRVVLTRLGGPEVLQVIDDEVRDPAAGEVRVRVIATGVAYADVLMRRGMYSGVPKLPYSPGYDIVGTVEACGPGVGLKPGSTVAALTQTGGYSQYLILAEREAVPVPDGVDPAEAVSLVLNYTTAYQLIHRAAGLKEGDSVLIHGAAGGVGTAALQLGSMVHLKMYGTASRSKHELVSSLGGIPIDYRSEDFVERVRKEEGGVDAVFDPVGGSNWWRSYRALRHGGRLIGYGMSAAIANGRRNVALAAASFAMLGALRLLPGKQARWYSIMIEKKEHPDWFREDLTRLLGMLKAGAIRPVIAERLPLRSAARAHELLESAAVTGKIVLMCQQ